jgi:hypothetical protein
MSYRTTFLKSHLIIIFFIFSILLFIGTGIWASARIFTPLPPKPQEINLHVINKSNALHVSSIEKTDGQYPHVKITLMNQSPKNITAYVLSIGDLSVTTDFASLGSFLAPGEKHQGIKEQLARILPALRGQLNSPQADSATLLETLDSQVSQLPTETSNVTLSHGYRSGLNYIRQSLDINIKDLKNRKKSTPDFNQKAELRRLVEFYEQILTKL